MQGNIRVFQRSRINRRLCVYVNACVCLCVCVYGGGVLYGIDPCNFRDLAYNVPSTSWTPRKAGGIIQSEYKGLKTCRTNGVGSSLGLKASEPGMLRVGEDWCPLSLSSLARRVIFFFPLPFVLFSLSRIGCCPSISGRSSCFTDNSDTHFIQQHPYLQTYPHVMLSQIFGHLVIQLR